MKSINIRILKHETRALMDRIATGESVEITRHNQPVAIIKPVEARRNRRPRPDFKGRLQAIYGEKLLPETATELISEERGER
ncbi:type II toxin-antitoxin system Phd/YefM family antitoxin [Puniceicoccus vermicola]|uniref:Antitoxin n=1 Tax=Puniceicoccus vermicola TaxID=388746 RepID=A0A7X1B249_9BACT|nr:type II toxin-antitoxin system Phd/YefM family antitoxin [Puniceicoccus vermicola]MBC2604241.1 type II toxin-antitoxin system Phd/YefM family antitoxin [Puniceicoccus vermicola]